ncbi:hypothetical protein [Methylobacterium sp. J-076]|uniref:hypothetical protein n=1 Tax=Methylobacterium sp. J-076 TaxID=2836655 RepID=UPI001FB9DFFC|nr:hypothetical protein [Methylobacterium sp. J-076]MCJ2011851.1 hypothetical protein [Methylobacterium sp. J-076]
MRKSTLFAAAGLLAVGTAAYAAEGGPSTQSPAGNPGTRMQGSPNAAGFGKADTTGSAGASSAAPNREVKPDGKMHGSPNASGFNNGAGAATGR